MRMLRRVARGVSVGVVACVLAVASAAVADGDLVASVKTTKARTEMSAFLVKEAEGAYSKRDWPRAIPIYEALVVARGPASAEARKLADVYALAGRRDDAIDVLQTFSITTNDPDAKREADQAKDRIGAVNEAFGKPVTQISIDKLANQSFKLGRAAFAKKQYGDALVYYSMGYRLAPDLPGFLRELGATYDKLGASDKKVDFYLAYLRRRPFGKNADEVRKSLEANKGVLGRITISSSLPCEEVYVAAERVPGKLPVKEISMAPGKYKAFCLNYKYELGDFERVEVTAGQTAQLTFNWGIVVNKLESPFGRIAVATPDSNDVLLDLGVDQPELGVVVPADGHALRMVLKDDSGAQTKECFVKIAPGQRLVVTWKQC